MNAIPTQYKGVEYKSKLEAKWACFFDKIGVICEYEPFTITRNNHKYLPDFYTIGLFGDEYIETETNRFGDKICLIEVKPRMPNDTYINNLMNVREPGKCAIVGVCRDMFWGDDLKCFLIHGHQENKLILLNTFYACNDCNRLLFDWPEYQARTCCSCSQMIRPTTSPVNAYIYTKEYRFDLQ